MATRCGDIMYCTKCGNKNDDSSNFCGYCGAVLKSADPNGILYREPDVNNQLTQESGSFNTQQNGYAEQNYNQNTNYNRTPNYNQNMPTSRYNPMAIAGFITSCGCILFGGLAGLVGLILSLIGFHQTSVREEKGKGFAIAGIIIGCLSVAVTILLIIYIANADPYELRRFIDDFYYEYDYGTPAVKGLFSIFFGK